MFVKVPNLDARIVAAMLQPVVWSEESLARLLVEQGSDSDRAISQASYVLRILSEDELPDFVELIRSGVVYELAYDQVLLSR